MLGEASYENDLENIFTKSHLEPNLYSSVLVLLCYCRHYSAYTTLNNGHRSEKTHWGHQGFTLELLAAALAPQDAKVVISVMLLLTVVLGFTIGLPTSEFVHLQHNTRSFNTFRPETEECLSLFALVTESKNTESPLWFRDQVERIQPCSLNSLKLLYLVQNWAFCTQAK